MISFSASGSFNKTERFLKNIQNGSLIKVSLERYAIAGVDALSNATPKDSGLTAGSWYYEIVSDATSHSIVWKNRNVVSGQVIAILLQYGHGTGTGGYVAGRDYINPAIKPVMDKIAADVWKVVKSA